MNIQKVNDKPDRFRRPVLFRREGGKHGYWCVCQEYKAELSTSPVGNMIKLENLCLGIPASIPELEKRIEQYRRDMEQSRQEYEKPFLQEEELNEKTARLNELNVQLDLENGKAEDIDLCEEQDVSRVAEQGSAYHTR